MKAAEEEVVLCLLALRDAARALAYAAEKLPELKGDYDNVSRRIRLAARNGKEKPPAQGIGAAPPGTKITVLKWPKL